MSMKVSKSCYKSEEALWYVRFHLKGTFLPFNYHLLQTQYLNNNNLTDKPRVEEWHKFSLSHGINTSFNRDWAKLSMQVNGSPYNKSVLAHDNTDEKASLMQIHHDKKSCNAFKIQGSPDNDSRTQFVVTFSQTYWLWDFVILILHVNIAVIDLTLQP